MSTLDTLFEAVAAKPSPGERAMLWGSITTISLTGQNESASLAVFTEVPFDSTSADGETGASIVFPIQFKNAASQANSANPALGNLEAAGENATITKHQAINGPDGAPIFPVRYSLSFGNPWDSNVSIDAELTEDDTTGVMYGSQGDQYVTLAAISKNVESGFTR
jgi:hypothetical protein